MAGNAAAEHAALDAGGPAQIPPALEPEPTKGAEPAPARRSRHDDNPSPTPDSFRAETDAHEQSAGEQVNANHEQHSLEASVYQPQPTDVNDDFIASPLADHHSPGQDPFLSEPLSPHTHPSSTSMSSGQYWPGRFYGPAYMSATSPLANSPRDGRVEPSSPGVSQYAQRFEQGATTGISMNLGQPMLYNVPIRHLDPFALSHAGPIPSPKSRYLAAAPGRVAQHSLLGSASPHGGQAVTSRVNQLPGTPLAGPFATISQQPLSGQTATTTASPNARSGFAMPSRPIASASTLAPSYARPRSGASLGAQPPLSSIALHAPPSVLYPASGNVTPNEDGYTAWHLSQARSSAATSFSSSGGSASDSEQTPATSNGPLSVPPLALSADVSSSSGNNSSSQVPNAMQTGRRKGMLDQRNAAPTQKSRETTPTIHGRGGFTWLLSGRDASYAAPSPTPIGAGNVSTSAAERSPSPSEQLQSYAAGTGAGMQGEEDKDAPDEAVSGPVGGVKKEALISSWPPASAPGKQLRGLSKADVPKGGKTVLHPRAKATTNKPETMYQSAQAALEDMVGYHQPKVKPTQPYPNLIRLTLLASPTGKLCLSDLYDAVADNFPWYKGQGTGWKNSIRYNLSINSAFLRVERPRKDSKDKGSLWFVDTRAEPATVRPPRASASNRGAARTQRSKLVSASEAGLDLSSPEAQEEGTDAADEAESISSNSGSTDAVPRASSAGLAIASDERHGGDNSESPTTMSSSASSEHGARSSKSVQSWPTAKRTRSKSRAAQSATASKGPEPSYKRIRSESSLSLSYASTFGLAMGMDSTAVYDHALHAGPAALPRATRGSAQISPAVEDPVGLATANPGAFIPMFYPTPAAVGNSALWSMPLLPAVTPGGCASCNSPASACVCGRSFDSGPHGLAPSPGLAAIDGYPFLPASFGSDDGSLPPSHIITPFASALDPLSAASFSSTSTGSGPIADPSMMPGQGSSSSMSALRSAPLALGQPSRATHAAGLMPASSIDGPPCQTGDDQDDLAPSSEDVGRHPLSPSWAGLMPGPMDG
ncbi:hypothetical protein V8E36_001702 [Tilletia maclaganii]